MDLLHLVDRLEELVAGAQKMPIGNRAILDRRRMLDLIDGMRIAVPHEVREAQDIVANRDAIRREAEEEARIIVAEAEDDAARLVEEHAITDAAKRRAEEIAREAERRLEARIDEANRDIQARLLESRRLARDQMEAADEYARELLLRLERQLQAFQNSVRAGVQQLEPQPSFERDLPPLDDREVERITGVPAGEPRAEFGDYEPHEPVVTPAPRAAAPPAPSAAYEEHVEMRAGAGRSRFEDVDELENLLQRRPASARAAAGEQEPGIIDDFEMESLDDDPTLQASERAVPGRDDR